MGDPSKQPQQVNCDSLRSIEHQQQLINQRKDLNMTNNIQESCTSQQ